MACVSLTGSWMLPQKVSVQKGLPSGSASTEKDTETNICVALICPKTANVWNQHGGSFAFKILRSEFNKDAAKKTFCLCLCFLKSLLWGGFRQSLVPRLPRDTLWYFARPVISAINESVLLFDMWAGWGARSWKAQIYSVPSLNFSLSAVMKGIVHPKLKLHPL